MKLRIEVDSGESCSLLTNDCKVWVDDKQVGGLYGIQFSADISATVCELILKFGDVNQIK